MSPRCGRLVSVLILLTALPALAAAQGFGIYEHGACMMAQAAAGVAAPCADGSAIYVNPAGIAGSKGLTIGSGGMLIHGLEHFTSDAGVKTGIEGGTSMTLAGYGVYGLSDRLAIGAGLYFPYGLGVEWPLDFEGRFVSYDTRLRTFYVQPTIAYAVSERFSIGGGLTIARSTVELNRREDLARVPLGIGNLTFGALVDEGTDFADTRLKSGGATGWGFNVGAIARPAESFSVGARFLKGVKLSYEGDATFSPIARNFAVTRPNPLGVPVGAPLDAAVSQVFAALPSQTATTELTMPAQLVLGVARVWPAFKLLVDYQWVDWSAFDTVVLDFSAPVTPNEELPQNYEDTSAIRIGGEYRLNNTTWLRAGYAINQAAAPDQTVTPLLPDARRQHITVGLGRTFNALVAMDFAYQLVLHADRRGRVVNPPPGVPPTAALNSGVYASTAHLFGLTVTMTPHRR